MVGLSNWRVDLEDANMSFERKSRMPVVSKQGPKGVVKKKLGTIADRIQNLSFEDNDFINILIYGASGTGKTTLWATFPGPILSLICSSLQHAGELRSVNTPEYKKKIKTLELLTFDDAREIIQYLTEEPHPYKTVVLDHCSGLQDLSLREILGLAQNAPIPKNWGDVKQQDYGKSTMICREVFRGLLNVKANTVLVAQERSFGGDENGDSEIQTPVIGAALTPALVGWLNPACDYVVQTYKRPKMKENIIKLGTKTSRQIVRDKGIEYCVRTAPHDIYTTKFRVPKGQEIPECIVDPDFEKIMALINGEQ